MARSAWSPLRGLQVLEPPRGPWPLRPPRGPALGRTSPATAPQDQGSRPTLSTGAPPPRARRPDPRGVTRLAGTQTTPQRPGGRTPPRCHETLGDPQEPSSPTPDTWLALCLRVFWAWPPGQCAPHHPCAMSSFRTCRQGQTHVVGAQPVTEGKFLCPMHSEAKQREKLEFGVKKGLLQSPTRRTGWLVLKTLNSSMVFKEKLYRKSLG